MAKVALMDWGVAGAEIAIEYNDATKRLTQVSWSIPAGYAIRARIWANGELRIDRTVGGPSTGAESVPGVIRVVEVTEDFGTFFDLPDGIEYTFNVESIG